ncbi:MAG: permease [candidate division Zixibacteria bacterium]|nr:permease [candidate division Zixibacteria bacterium]
MIERCLIEIWNILLDLSFPLIVGIAIAGAVHVILPAGFVHRNLGKRGLGSIIKAALIGVPMPLCSCGVIPTAVGLKQDGASNGASTSFLISTPQTGVDSILVSASFLGWPFAIFKLIVSFITGIIGGAVVDLFDNQDGYTPKQSAADNHFSGYQSRLKEAVNFGIFELFGMIYRWLIVGILLAALISLFVPSGYLSTISWIGGIGGLFLMLLISLPLYVCATASVPIAASLIAAGMPPGAAMVLLMAGPASNIATIGAVFRAFGGKILTIYLATVSIFSIFFGWLFDFIINSGESLAIQHHQNNEWFIIASAVTVIGLSVFMIFNDLQKKYHQKLAHRGMSRDRDIRQSHESTEADMRIQLSVQGMTCQHCAANVTKALESVEGAKVVNVSTDENLAVIDGNPAIDDLIDSVNNAGYTATAL